MFREAMLTVVVVAASGGGVGAQEFKIAKADVEFKEGFDFTQYTTYAWKESQEPLPNAANQAAMTLAIDDGLRKKKLVRVEDEPDLEVRFFTRIETRSKATGYQGGAAVEQSNKRTMVRVDKSRTGQLTIELYDPKARTVVWKGTDSEPLGHSNQDEGVIRTIVARILREYPPRKK